MQALGCAVERLSYWPRAVRVPYELSLPNTVDPGEHLNVVGKLPGSGGGRSLLVFAHPDSELVTDIEAWQYDPYGGTIDRGRIHGCGVADDLVGVAIMVASLDVIRVAGLGLQGDVTLASTISKRRAQGIVNVLDHGYLADASLYLHPAESGVGLGEIKGITQGLLSFRITVRGKIPETTEPTHTPFLHLGISPLEKMFHIYQALSQLADRRAQQVNYPPLEEAVGRSTNLNVASIHYGDPNLPTRVSDTCILTGSLTFPPTESLTEVHGRLATVIHEAAAADPWLRDHPPEVEWLVGVSGSGLPREHPLYQTASRAVERVTGNEPKLNPLHASSDIRNPALYKGIPTVGLGPLAGSLSQIGLTDEWVDVEDYIRAIEVVGNILLDWCGAAAAKRVA